MAKNWAISIGINKYEFLQPPLKYAVRDAELIRDFLDNEGGFEKVWLMSDKSPDIRRRPSRENLLVTFEEMFKNPFMGNEDSFWFFFSGHGRRYAGKDYLMPFNSVSSIVEQTGIAISYITERLRRCGADNVVLIFDACRDEGDKAGGLGIGSEYQKGVITIYSCSPDEKSWEIDEISHGAFTYTLLEALRLQGEKNCATVERLDRYLRERVPQLNSKYGKQTQTPCINVESETKRHFILLPRQATLVADINKLKKDALLAEIEEDFELAEKLWIQINTACRGGDLEAVKAFQRIERKRLQMELRSPQPPLIREPKSEVDSIEIAAKSETESKTISVELVSTAGVDYTNLQQLLAAGKWREADEETNTVISKVVKWISNNAGGCYADFSRKDLFTIDQLWLKYSNGRFGFSVQKSIQPSLAQIFICQYIDSDSGVYDNLDYETIWTDFANHVGWRINGKWLERDQLTFDISALIGHLPYSAVMSFDFNERVYQNECIWIVGALYSSL